MVAAGAVPQWPLACADCTYFDGRNEKEVVVDPKQLQDIQEIKKDNKYERNTTT